LYHTCKRALALVLLVPLGACVFDVKLQPPVLSVSPINDKNPVLLSILGIEKFDRMEKDLSAMCIAQDYQLRTSNDAKQAIKTAFSSRFPGIKFDPASTLPLEKITVTVDEVKMKLRCPPISSNTMVCRSDTRIKISATMHRAGSKREINVVNTARGISEPGIHCSLGSEAMSESLSKSFEGALQKLIKDFHMPSRAGQNS
jgi:hypothetical protein